MDKYTLTEHFYEQFDNDFLITNPCGEHLFLSEQEYNEIYKSFNYSSQICNKLKSRFFLYENKYIESFKKIYDIKFSTKHSYLENDSLLLMVVPTISCNCNCVYCQVNSKKNTATENNMTLKTVLNFCDFLFSLPHKDMKVEFQGGEPTLQFDTIEFIVRRTNFLNRKYKKNISYVICTNLLSITSHQIKVIKKYKIAISSSLDGPRNIHNKNRPSPLYKSTYDSFINNLAILRANNIYPSGLVTITAQNLTFMKDIVDTYIKNNFESIFLRPLNNYGCAFENKGIYYNLNDYINAYKNAVSYIIERNLKEGLFFREEMFSILLRKIFSPFNDGFVDMQNPCALGQMSLIVKQNGDIYPSDESRMISEMGNEYWKMGNINNSDYLDTMKKKRLEILEDGNLSNYSECKTCVYNPFCYADPIKKWYIKNIAGETYESYCGIRKELFRFVFEQIKTADAQKLQLFRRWANV